MKKFLFLLFVLISFSIESQERFNNQMLNGEWEIIYDENNEGKKDLYKESVIISMDDQKKSYFRSSVGKSYFHFPNKNLIFQKDSVYYE